MRGINGLRRAIDGIVRLLLQAIIFITSILPLLAPEPLSRGDLHRAETRITEVVKTAAIEGSTADRQVGTWQHLAASSKTDNK